MNNDLISREALHEELKALRESPWFNEKENGVLGQAAYQARRDALSVVENLVIDNAPTVEQPTGEWSKWIISEIRCPNCLEYFDPEWHSAEELKKCPCCGARMKGNEEE